MDALEDEWTSARIVRDAHSSLIDLPLTVKQGDLFQEQAVMIKYGDLIKDLLRLRDILPAVFDLNNRESSVGCRRTVI